MKTNLLKSIFISLILVMGVSNAWAEHGFFNDEACGIKLNYSGTTTTEIKKNSSGASTQALGTITKLYLKGWWFAAWENTNDFTGNESGKLYYRVYLAGSPSGEYTSTTHTYYNWGGWQNNGSQNVWLGTDNLNTNILNGLVGGNYIFEYYFTMGSEYLSNESKNYTISFTYNPTYTVTVNAGTGGSVAKNSIVAGNITAVTLPEATPSNGYSFDKWAVTLGTLTLTNATSASAATVKARSAGTVTANFTPNQYTITYKDQGGSDFSGTHASGYPTKHTYGTATTLSTATKTGYTFGGWFTSSDCTGTAVTSLGATVCTADITLYAKWTPVPTLEISTNQQYLRVGKDKLQLTINHENIPENSKYRVHCTTTNGYYPNSSGLDNIDISGSGTINYTSQSSLGLGKLKFVVEIYNSNNLIIKSDEIQVTVQQDWEVAVYKKIDNIETLIRNISPTENIGVEVTAEVVTGYAFTGWTSNTINITFEDASAPSTLVYAKSEGVIYANYTKMYDVQVSVAAGQESWGSVSTNSVSVGQHTTSTNITATANTNLGYVFDHWEISGGITITTGDANSATIKITATKDGSLTAHFRGENRLQNIYLIGTMNNWKKSDANWQFYKLPGESGNTVTLTKTINKSDFHSDGYKFGINIFHSDWQTTHWKNAADKDTKMDAHNCTGWGFNAYSGDYKTYIDLNVSGEYTFTLTDAHESHNQKLSITYPDKSFIEGNFATAWDENAYPLTENGNIQTVTIPITSKKDVEFRLVSHGKLFGSDTQIRVGSNSQTLSPKNMADNGAVMTIGAYVEGDYVFSYNKSTNELTVTYPSVNQLQVYTANPAHDAAKKNWDWDSQNGNVYTKTLSLNANTTYTFKAVVNSDFYGKNETTLTRKNQSVELNTGGGNVTIKTDIAGNYTFTFNTSTKALSVTYPIAHTITYGVGDDGNGIVSESSDIKSGTLLAENTSISLNATPNLGYKFVGWYSEAACTSQVISTANPYNFPINSTTTLYAKFEERDLYIHTDIIGWGTTAKMTQDDTNKAVYTYTIKGLAQNATNGADYNTGYHFRFTTKEPSELVYNWNNVQEPKYEGSSIDGVHLTDQGNPTIQFGLTRKSDVTITLTLQSANDDPEPTVHIEAIPYYNITLDQTGCAQQGTPTVEVKSGNAMPEIDLPEAPTGYIFGGYYDQKDGAGNKYYNANGTSATTWDKNDDGTLYAQWTPKEYTITYNLNGGNGTMTPTIYTIESETFALPDNPTKTGYTFAGWYANAELTGEAVTQIEQGSTGDKAYWAKWNVASYTITFDTEGGTGGPSELTVPFGTQLPDITIPTKAGHLFLGYYDGDGGTGTQYYDASGKGLKKMPANNLTLHAKWLNGSDCIFFYNNLGWSNVYVYFYNNADGHNYWADDYGTGANKQQKFWKNNPYYEMEHGTMTQIKGTNIWYYYATYIKTNQRSKVSFANVNQSCDKEANNTNSYFQNAKVVYRADLDYEKRVPMFVPHTTQSHYFSNTKSTYYNHGYWMNYPENTGYKLHIFDEYGNKISDQLVDIPFEYGDNMIMPWSVNVSLEGAKTYAFKIQRADNQWYGNNGTMTTNSSGDVGQTAWQFTTGTNNCKITTTAAGTYVFTLKYDKDAYSHYNYLVGVEYPASEGDYRLAYKDNAHPFHPGHLLKKREGKDTVSFFVHYDESPVIMLQQVTDINANTGAITWETLKTYALTANQAGSEDPGQAMMPGRRNAGADEVILHIGGEHLEDVDTTGVYNFILEQTADEATLQGSATKYDGDFYIRTNAAAGGWGDFRQAGNKMTYSSYAEKSNSDFNHYFVEWVKTETGGNVKFTIANDYSYCISDTLDADNIIQKNGVSPGCLPADANVRFGWDSRNNKLTRAYIAGSGNVWDRFLVVTGNDLLKDASGNVISAGPSEVNDETKKNPRCNLKAHEVIFTDLGNWVYQVDVTAQNGTMINLTALYNGTIQYFKGAEGDPSYPLLASTNVGKPYKIRMIYNFKTNNLVVAWMPESPYNANGDEYLGTDMLLIRRNQDPATQLKLNSIEEKDTISGIKTAYAVMTFTKTFVKDDNKPIHERKHYWVSFPFDVKISDVFGFSEYKDHWIMQAYDGAGRAANGLWADTDTYWRYITNNNFVMRKGQGYVLTLDVKKMLELDPVFENTEEVSLYFPSRGELDTITSYLPTAATVPAHTCTIERENRKIYDSHWNMIGVPGFADIANFETTAPDNYLKEPELKYEGDSLSFYYAYIPSKNSYQVVKADTTFQSMYSYMVQFAGTINWSSKEVTYNGQQQLAARRNSEGEYPEKVSFRLELAQGDKMADQTFVQLQEEGATTEFDMNLDLTKIINSGANIYTLVGNSRIQTAGNALPMDEAVVVPVGVKIDAEGEYTFRMPDGTEGMVVELVDYETYNRTNLLLTDYTVTLPKGTNEYRFALHIQPQKDVVTSLENIGEGVNNGEAVNKYLIDGKLIIRTAEGIFDAQGHRL